MTTITPVLEALDLAIATGRDKIELTRDQACQIAEHLRQPEGEPTDEQLLKVWTVGFQSGMHSTLANASRLVAERGPDVFRDHQLMQAATTGTGRYIWADPAARDMVIEASRAAITGHVDGCVCGAPWHEAGSR